MNFDADTILAFLCKGYKTVHVLALLKAGWNILEELFKDISFLESVNV